MEFDFTSFQTLKNIGRTGETSFPFLRLLHHNFGRTSFLSEALNDASRSRSPLPSLSSAASPLFWLLGLFGVSSCIYSKK